MSTARREAQEEMGNGLPHFTVVDKIETKRGKRGQKHYTVFLCALTPEAKAEWAPRICLNDEHTDIKWHSLPDLRATNLHPVVKTVFEEDYSKPLVLKALQDSHTQSS